MEIRPNDTSPAYTALNLLKRGRGRIGIGPRVRVIPRALILFPFSLPIFHRHSGGLTARRVRPESNMRNVCQIHFD